MSTHRHPSPSLDQLLVRLKENALKLTPPRKFILSALLEGHGPFSAEDLHRDYVKKHCDLATVYRTLTSLEEAKMIRRCEFGDGVARYELMEEDDLHHHHHLVCKECKKVEVIDISSLEESLEKFGKKSGYQNVTHILEFFGLCPNCQ